MARLAVPGGGLGELLGLHPLQLLDRQPALRELVAPLLASLVTVSTHIQSNKKKRKQRQTYLLRLLMLRRRLQHGRHVVRKAQLLQRLGDVVAGDGLLGLLLGDLVGLGGDEGDELDAALYEEVAGLLGEDAATRGGEDLGDDLLDRRWGVVSIVTGRVFGEGGGYPLEG